MQRDTDSLLDILDSARLALGYVAGKTYEEFLDDQELQDAVIRRITIIGEATRRLSEEARRAIPEIPWQEIVGMRNVVIHQYDEGGPKYLWETVRLDLPRLVQFVELRLPQDPPSSHEDS